nr:RNA-directed DNA polymerase, eukaryota, reverse transcriptase zinc-binding domain protein [Tanacetum cinerariifolium]
MSSHGSKVDEVQKIFSSVFITNFPDSFSARDLFKTCSIYGNVVDAYIPNKRSKAGKRVKELASLSNLKKVLANKGFDNIEIEYLGLLGWRLKVFRLNCGTRIRLNVLLLDGVLYYMLMIKKMDVFTGGECVSRRRDLFKTCSIYGNVVDAYIPNKQSKARKRFGFVSFIKVVNIERLVNNLCGTPSVNAEAVSSPAMVLEDDCLNQQDLAHSLMGRVKELASLSNLKKVLANKGFDNIEIEYLEALGWVPDLLEDNEEDYESDWESKEGDVKGDVVGLKSCSILGEDSDVEGVSETKLKEGYFNEVRKKIERFGSVFNINGANAFNLFISKAGLEEILLDTWKEAPMQESNAVETLMKKLKYLKQKIREWHKVNKKSDHTSRLSLKKELDDLDKVIDNEEGSNSSFIILIPKISDAHMVNDDRPISLIGSLYKINAKILANRLVNVFGDMLNEVQSAFIADRQILYDPFILNELFLWCSKVGGLMSRIQSWNEFVDRVTARLSKWKMKTLSIGGRLTILKSVLGSMSIYHMLNFKVPMRVLQRLESIRSHLFKGNDIHGKNLSWVKWKNVLASKEKGGLGVSSLYALNRGLMLKWVWRFITQSLSLWARVIKEIHRDDEKIGKNAKSNYPSIWLDIVHEMKVLKKQGINIKIKLGNGENTSFWDDIWRGDSAFKYLYPKLYVLESCKDVKVGSKLSHARLDFSFRRAPRGSVKEDQLIKLSNQIEGVILTNSRDRWIWTLEGSGEFSVTSVRKLIDDNMLSESDMKTR